MTRFVHCLVKRYHDKGMVLNQTCTSHNNKAFIPAIEKILGMRGVYWNRFIPNNDYQFSKTLKALFNLSFFFPFLKEHANSKMNSCMLDEL